MGLTLHILDSAPGIPNNVLPLIHYKQVLSDDQCSPDGCSSLFLGNGWGRTWLNGVYPYWHYHAHAHEVLGCIAGSAKVGFGGNHGIVADFAKGDVVLIPAGVGHNRFSQSTDFLVVGGYPKNQDGTISRECALAEDEAKAAVAAVPLPETDPVFRSSGGLIDYWKATSA